MWLAIWVASCADNSASGGGRPCVAITPPAFASRAGSRRRGFPFVGALAGQAAEAPCAAVRLRQKERGISAPICRPDPQSAELSKRNSYNLLRLPAGNWQRADPAADFDFLIFCGAKKQSSWWEIARLSPFVGWVNLTLRQRISRQ